MVCREHSACTETLLKELSRRTFEGFSCQLCGASLSKDSLWFDHICMNHPDVLNDLSCKEIISGLKEANADLIFSVANSKLTSVHSSCVFIFVPLGHTE